MHIELPLQSITLNVGKLTCLIFHRFWKAGICIRAENQRKGRSRHFSQAAIFKSFHSCQGPNFCPFDANKGKRTAPAGRGDEKIKQFLSELFLSHTYIHEHTHKQGSSGKPALLGVLSTDSTDILYVREVCLLWKKLDKCWVNAERSGQARRNKTIWCSPRRGTARPSKTSTWRGGQKEPSEDSQAGSRSSSV